MSRPLSGRWRLGVLLAVLTALLWGLVPLAMMPLIGTVDAATITWFRFLCSGLLLLLLLGGSGRLHRPRGLPRGTLAWYGLAVLGLSVNYALYVQSLHYVDATVTQVVVQLAPVLLMLGSILVFGERFAGVQWVGFTVLVAGIAGFCIERVRQSGAPLDRAVTGVLIVVLSASAWAVYGLIQKRLLACLPAQPLLMAIYLAGALLLTPWAHPADLLRLDASGMALLLFLVLNTVIGYGAFVEAMNHWESSKVSAVLALQPVTTLLVVQGLEGAFPQQFPDVPLSLATLGAAATVVLGSLGCTLGSRRPSA